MSNVNNWPNNYCKNKSSCSILWVSSKRHIQFFKLKRVLSLRIACFLNKSICFLEDPLFEWLISQLQPSCLIFFFFDEIHSWKGSWLSEVWEGRLQFCMLCSLARKHYNVGYMPSHAFSYVFLQFEPKGRLEVAVGYFLLELWNTKSCCQN